MQSRLLGLVVEFAVWTPRSCEGADLPVLLFIHGGDNSIGVAADLQPPLRPAPAQRAWESGPERGKVLGCAA